MISLKRLAFILSLLLSIHIVGAYDLPIQDESIYVNDYANMLDEEDEESLVNSISKSDDKIIIVTTMEEDLIGYSEDLFNEWNIEEEGMLLIINEQGDYNYLLNTDLSSLDEDIELVLEEYLEPFIESDDYDIGIIESTLQMLDVLEVGEYQEYEDSQEYNFSNSGNLMLFIVCLIIVIGCIGLLLYGLIGSIITLYLKNKYKDKYQPGMITPSYVWKKFKEKIKSYK